MCKYVFDGIRRKTNWFSFYIFFEFLSTVVSFVDSLDFLGFLIIFERAEAFWLSTRHSNVGECQDPRISFVLRKNNDYKVKESCQNQIFRGPSNEFSSFYLTSPQTLSSLCSKKKFPALYLLNSRGASKICWTSINVSTFRSHEKHFKIVKADVWCIFERKGTGTRFCFLIPLFFANRCRR